MKKTTPLVILLTLFLVVTTAALAYFFFRSPAPNYIISKRGSIHEAVYGLGKVKSHQIFEYKSAVSKTIQKLAINEGSSVKRGDRLIIFDEGPSVIAPFDGTVTALPYRENENIFPSTPLIRIENLGTRYVELALEQQGALRVKPGQKARLSFESFRGQLFFGTVKSIYPSNDQFLVRIEPQDLPAVILPGMTADIAVEIGQRDSVLMVPVASVNSGKVTVLRNNKKTKVNVEIGSSDGEWAEVLKGDISENEAILVPRIK